MSARTFADAALLLAAFGCDPSLAPLRPTQPDRAAWTGPTRTGTIGTYLFALDRPDAEPISHPISHQVTRSVTRHNN